MRQDTRWETTLRLGSDAYLPKKRFVQRQYSISIYCLQFHCICSQKQKVLECLFLSCWPYYQPRILLAMSGPSINKAVFSKIVSHHNIKCAINQVTQNVLFRPQNAMASCLIVIPLLFQFSTRNLVMKNISILQNRKMKMHLHGKKKDFTQT